MNPQRILTKSKSWKSFKSHLKPLSTKQKGDSFEYLTKYYLQLHPTYVTQLKHVWLLSEVPTKVRKKLNLPGPDEGIDLIAETRDETYWAIQSKYKEDEGVSLSRKELATFTDLAFNICRNIELGLVCTSADRFSHKLKMYGDRLSFCSGEIWRGLDKEFFDRLHKLLKGKTATINPLKPRPHQQRAIENAHKHYIEERNSRGKLIMPCATGKSLAGYWIAQKLEAKTILIAVPSLALIRQTVEVWGRELVANKKVVSWIAVCSDAGVGDIDRDDVSVLIQDLGLKVYNDPNEIAGWLKRRKKGLSIVFTTYQSGKITCQAAKKAKKVFDMAIMDEAHKTVGAKDSLFSHLLFDKNIKIKMRVFMTATERRYRGQSDQIMSMDNPEIYGETFELLTFGEAVKAKPPILSDYKIITLLVTKKEIQELIKKNIFVKPDKGKWSKEVEAEMLAGVVALRNAMRKHPIKKAVSFHNSVARARAYKANQDIFTKTFQSYGALDTFHVSGTMPTSARAKEIDEFAESERSLVTNARCLTEGVDVPKIDCVTFADPKNSAIDIVQAVGRAIRPYEGKKHGYVIVPVLLDKEITKEDDIQKRTFDSVLMTLRALASDDERIIEYFRSVSQGIKHGSGSGPVDFVVPVGVKLDTKKFLQEIQLKVWSRLAKLSWRPFEEAREFVRALGLKSTNEWKDYCTGRLRGKGEKPFDIPSLPNSVYANYGWIGYWDWLGTGHRRGFWRPFMEARIFARSLNLKNWKEWLSYCHGNFPDKKALPENIPTKPNLSYKNDGWINFGDWLGTGNISNKGRKWLSYLEARKFVHKLGLKGQYEWAAYSAGKLTKKRKRPSNIPGNPNEAYEGDGWVNWADWLGHDSRKFLKRNFLPFKEAREFARQLNLKTCTEWYKYCRGDFPERESKPKNIPRTADSIYKDQGWISWPDWLGTENKKKKSR
jgi:superfamily II DNA or RNA helicase